MPSVVTSSLPIDRDSVEELKEKLLGLLVENGKDEVLQNVDNDEGIDDADEGDSTFTEVALILDGIGMRKHIHTFKQEGIDLKTFLNLTENDLEELGISSAKDRKIIIENLGEHREPSTCEFLVPENHSDDYQISKNVQNHLLLVQSYIALVECQMRKNEYIDYNITPTETALKFFTEFTKAAIKQAELITNLLHQQNSSNHIIGMILKENELVLPDDLKEKLIKKKSQKKKNHVHRIVTFVGLSVVLVFAASKLLKRIIH